MADRHRDRGRLGRLRDQLLLDARAGATRSTSTSRSGSTSRRSSPSRCSTSSTRSRSRSSLLKSYSIYGGVQDALVQWWYGHNAVAFFLTTPILGIMYYFLPKAAERPVYSYRLSIIHFWSLIFVYIWAGPHHLLNTALPDWAQTLGMVFSVDALGAELGRHAQRPAHAARRVGQACAPIRCSSSSPPASPSTAWRRSRGRCSRSRASTRSRTTPTGSSATSTRGALGWNGFMAAGMFYWLVPRLYGTKLHSKTLADTALLARRPFGILLYVVVDVGERHHAGPDVARDRRRRRAPCTRTSSRRCIAIKPDVLDAPRRRARCTSSGMLMMAYNLVQHRARRQGRRRRGRWSSSRAPPSTSRAGREIALRHAGHPRRPSSRVARRVAGRRRTSRRASSSSSIAVVGRRSSARSRCSSRADRRRRPTWHRLLEGRALVFTVAHDHRRARRRRRRARPVAPRARRPTRASPTTAARTRALELEGRDVYIREGCYTCHSQMIRTLSLRDAALRRALDDGRVASTTTRSSGAPSAPAPISRARAASTRTSGTTATSIDPRSMSPGSNMPPYADARRPTRSTSSRTADKMRAMRSVGVPYKAARDRGRARRRSRRRARGLHRTCTREARRRPRPTREIVALIAYLQRLGVHPSPAAPAGSPVSMAK